MGLQRLSSPTTRGTRESSPALMLLQLLMSRLLCDYLLPSARVLIRRCVDARSSGGGVQASVGVWVCVLLIRGVMYESSRHNTMQVHVFIFVQWWDRRDLGNEHGGEGHMLGESPPHHHHQPIHSLTHTSKSARVVCCIARNVYLACMCTWVSLW